MRHLTLSADCRQSIQHQRRQIYQHSHNWNAKSAGLATSNNPIQVTLHGVDDHDCSPEDETVGSVRTVIVQ